MQSAKDTILQLQTDALNSEQTRVMLSRDVRAKDFEMQNMMKNINTVKVETLSRQQIEQARKRRAGDLAKKKKGKGGSEGDKLEDFSIPDNHPWAEKKEVDATDEELIKARVENEKLK